MGKLMAVAFFFDILAAGVSLEYKNNLTQIVPKHLLGPRVAAGASLAQRERIFRAGHALGRRAQSTSRQVAPPVPSRASSSPRRGSD